MQVKELFILLCSQNICSVKDSNKYPKHTFLEIINIGFFTISY